MNVAGMAIGAGVAGGIGAIIYFAGRGPTVEQASQRMFGAYDHDGNTSVDYARSPQSIDQDERFTKGSLHDKGEHSFPVTDVSDGWAKYGVRVFTKADTDGNGAVSGAEQLAYAKEADKDGNGRISTVWPNNELGLDTGVVRMAPKQLDYRAPQDIVGVVDY